MTIHNQDVTDTNGFDLKGLIEKYGPPHYPTKRNPVGTLNEVFWAAFFATLNEIIYENREDDFYKYGGRIYVPATQHLLRGQLTNDILRASNEWQGYRALSQLCNARHLGGVFTHLKGLIQMEGVFSRPREYVHVSNGVIELNGAAPKLVGFDPKFYSRNLIPIEYSPRAKCRKFIRELLKPLPEKDKLVLQKLFGMFVSGTNFLQKILILQGAPGSGKSVLAAVARLLIGPVNCTELRTAHLGDRFELSRYMSKILLIGADVAGDFLNQPGASNLKKMTGGDIIGLERKYSNHECSILGVFCVLITCNTRLTVILDGDRGAWLRRLVMLTYGEKTHKIDIPHFAHKLVQEEGSGILNWALEGLELANQDVATIGELAQSDEQRKRVTALLDESEGLLTFVTNHIKADPLCDLTTEEILKHYAVYCGAPERDWHFNLRSVERQLPGIIMQLFRVSKSNTILRDGAKDSRISRDRLRPMSKHLSAFVGLGPRAKHLPAFAVVVALRASIYQPSQAISKNLCCIPTPDKSMNLASLPSSSRRWIHQRRQFPTLIWRMCAAHVSRFQERIGICRRCRLPFSMKTKSQNSNGRRSRDSAESPSIEDHEQLAQAIREIGHIWMASFNGRYLKGSAVFRSFRRASDALETLKSAMDGAFMSENPGNKIFLTSPYYNQGKRIQKSEKFQ